MPSRRFRSQRRRSQTRGCCFLAKRLPRQIRDLVDGRVGDRKGVYLRLAVEYAFERLQYPRIGLAMIRIRAIGSVPQADGYRLAALPSDDRNLVVKPFLFPEDGHNFTLQRPGIRHRAARAKLHAYLSCKHALPPD